MKIKIADGLSLPIDAVTQTFAQIGRRGSGKTYLASMIAGQMLDAQAQVIVIDPIGNWWGLRVDADGKSKGKDIFIIGGSHGDVPIAAESGKEIAKLLTEKEISVVLDISEFRKGERKRFVTDFAEEFYHLKKNKASPVHIFLEESQKFVPQKVQKDETRMLGAWEDIIRLGKNHGIGCSLICQRPQTVNKEVLSQVECLCVLQITGLHERKALEEWVQESGHDRKLVGNLPSLQRGEGYVWSPAWLRIYKKVKFLKKTTFDTSSTPELGKATKAAKISKMDIVELQKHMTSVIDKAKKENLDKKALIEEINRLKREISQNKSHVPKKELVVDQRALNTAKKEGYSEAERNYSESMKELKQIKNFHNSHIKIVQKAFSDIAKIVEKDMPKLNLESIKSPVQIKPASHIKPIVPATPVINQPVANAIVGDEKITGGAMRILQAAAMYHPNPITRVRMATIARLSYKSGSFKTYIATLKRNGLLEGNGDSFSITNEGLSTAGDVGQLPTDPEYLVDMWVGIVKGGAGRMLKALADNYPASLTKEELAQKVDMDVPVSGSFKTYIATLKRNGLINVEGSEITASSELCE